MANINVKVEKLDTVNSIDVRLWVREGSRADPLNKRGIHHLLGTLLTRGCGNYNNLEFADIVESCGAYLRCFINEDGLLISLKCSKVDINVLFPLLVDMIMLPKLDVNQIYIEKKLSLQSLKKNNENPYQIGFNNWKSIAYKDSGYQFDSLGIAEDIKMVTRNDISNLSHNLMNRNISVVVSGDINSVAEKLIYDSLTMLRLTKYDTNLDLSSKLEINNRPINNNRVILCSQDTKQVVIMLGTSTVDHSSNEDIKLKLINCHLGSGMSSVLFKKLREENGVAYDIGIYNPIREYNSPFVIHTSTTEENSTKSFELLNECLDKIVNTKLTINEMNMAKSKLKGNFAHNSQTVGQRTERNVILLGFGMKENHDHECLKRLEAITSEEILETAQKHLTTHYISLVGPEDTINKLKDQSIK